MSFIEILGYIASVLVALSLMMSNILRLRIINAIGALAFSIYGLIIHAYPVAVVNGWIFFVDIYYLIKMMSEKDSFELFEVRSFDSAYFVKFLDFYRKDIEEFFPEFKVEKLNDSFKAVFISRNMVSVGLFIYGKTENKEIEILLDYTIPAYRDLKNAMFLYHSYKEKFKKEGFEYFVVKNTVRSHHKYLKKLGFEQDSSDKNLFRSKI